MLLAVALAARHIDITNHATLLLALASPYLMLAVPAAGLWYLARRRVALAACAGVLTAGVVFVLLPQHTGTLQGMEVRVMSANLLHGNAEPAAVIDLARSNADVVSLQELTGDALIRLSANGMDEAFPYRIVKPQSGGSGAGLWSRYPLHETGSSSEPVPITAHLDLPGTRKSPTIVVVHLSAPWPWTIDWWRTDIAELSNQLHLLEGAVVVAGDFNSTREMAQFRRMLDSGYRAASGFAPTYPAHAKLPPLLAIDHILTHDISSSRSWTATIPGSDHRAVLATVQIPLE